MEKDSKPTAAHVGIVACSAEGAALCYRTICLEALPLMGEHDHPRITMSAIPMARHMEAIRKDDWKGVAELMLDSAREVAAAGAAFAICPDNTLHQALPDVLPRSPIPWLHIAEVVGDEARRRGFRRLGVLGTRYLMEGPVYRDALASRGIEMRVPPAAERETINRAIFGELVNAVFAEPTRQMFYRQIRALAEEGCDAAVLGCTEIPLIVRPGRCAAPDARLDEAAREGRRGSRVAAGLILQRFSACGSDRGVEETTSASTAPSRGIFEGAPLRVAKKTAAVHVGTRSRPGTSSATNDGRNPQCHPISLVSAAATARSRASFQGDRPPGAKIGKTAIWTRSAAIAIARAALTRFEPSIAIVVAVMTGLIAKSSPAILAPAPAPPAADSDISVSSPATYPHPLCRRERTGSRSSNRRSGRWAARTSPASTAATGTTPSPS